MTVELDMSSEVDQSSEPDMAGELDMSLEMDQLLDECAVDNGGCGDPAYFTCTYNEGAAPTCADIDECATDNGGCGDPIYYTCTNNEGADPTCADIDECASLAEVCAAEDPALARGADDHEDFEISVPRLVVHSL